MTVTSSRNAAYGKGCARAGLRGWWPCGAKLQASQLLSDSVNFARVALLLNECILNYQVQQ